MDDRLSSLRRKFLIVLILSFSGFDVARAATIRTVFDTTRSGKTYELALLSGTIGTGDTRTVARYFLANPDVFRLRLNSGGGDVIEAARIGELVKVLRLEVVVVGNGVCASACFFIWMNGAMNRPGIAGGSHM